MAKIAYYIMVNKKQRMKNIAVTGGVLLRQHISIMRRTVYGYHESNPPEN